MAAERPRPTAGLWAEVGPRGNTDRPREARSARVPIGRISSAKNPAMCSVRPKATGGVGRSHSLRIVLRRRQWSRRPMASLDGCGGDESPQPRIR